MLRLFASVLMALLLALQWAWWFGKGGLRDASKLEDQIAAQERKLDTLRTRNGSFAAEVMDLKEGLDAVEEIARSEMGMVRSGEVFYQLVEPAPGTVAAAEAVPENSAP